jgi:hypothetical protein
VCVRQEIRLPKGLLLRSLQAVDQGLKVAFLLKCGIDTDSLGFLGNSQFSAIFADLLRERTARIAGNAGLSPSRAASAKKPAEKSAGGPPTNH